MQSEQYDRQLTPSQKKAVSHIEGPLLVIAGPGSGKTRVITYRIAALIDSSVLPKNICAITFTNKAAEQMRQRTDALGTPTGAHISTFHSLCVRILRQYAAQANIKSNFSIYNDSDQTRCIKQATKDCGIDKKNFPPSRCLNTISSLKNSLIDTEPFEAQADDFFSKTLSKIYNRYQQILTENNALDFDDLLTKTAILLHKNKTVCSQLSNRFKFLLIDEYQDTNHAQYTIAKELASAHNNICATGDPDQSIYRWRGADIRNILDFENDWPDAVTIKLEENFRSTPNILEAADKLISKNKNRKQKVLIPTKPKGHDISVTSFDDEHEEALGIADQIKKLIKQKTTLNDIAIFYRINAQSRSLEEAFIKNKIPYQIIRGVEFYNRKEIRDMLAYLKVLANPADQIALLRVINTPARGIGKTTITKVLNFAASHKISLFDGLKKVEQISSLSKAPKTKIAVFVNMLEQFKADSSGKVGPLTERIFIESGLQNSFKAAGSEGSDAIENVNELINAIHAYDQQTEEPSLVDYLQQISLFSDTDTYDPSGQRIALMTLHAAKGLEFENVFIIGVEEGLLPHERSADDDDELEEERRLLFVGITRAKANLNITYARYRTIRGQFLRTIPSQFLFELGIDITPSDSELPEDHHDDGYYYDESTSQLPPQFKKNQLVRHEVFGLGRVQKYNDMGENSTATVKFNTGHIKTLMLKYTKLEKIKNL
ncbi:MAG: UvrD-helicase domain-containing protein [Planctomycetes bacterium]|nr:UvrD-helicase domain-containing protein [Planctomycetota bacterium]